LARGVSGTLVMTSFPVVGHVSPENGSAQVWNPNCHLVSIIIPLPTNHRDLAVPHGEVATSTAGLRASDSRPDAVLQRDMTW